MRFTRVPDGELEFHGGTRMVFVGPEDSEIEPLETMCRELTIGDVTADAFTARDECVPGHHVTPHRGCILR